MKDAQSCRFSAKGKSLDLRFNIAHIGADGRNFFARGDAFQGHGLRCAWTHDIARGCQTCPLYEVRA